MRYIVCYVAFDYLLSRSLLFSSTVYLVTFDQVLNGIKLNGIKRT